MHLQIWLWECSAVQIDMVGNSSTGNHPSLRLKVARDMRITCCVSGWIRLSLCQHVHLHKPTISWKSGLRRISQWTWYVLVGRLFLDRLPSLKGEMFCWPSICVSVSWSLSRRFLSIRAESWPLWPCCEQAHPISIAPGIYFLEKTCCKSAPPFARGCLRGLIQRGPWEVL